jgi:hypothetical protein
MSAQSQPHYGVEKLIDTFAAWLKHRRELNEMRQLDRTDFERIADDLRVPSAALDEMVRLGPHASDELPVMLKALGIDEQALSRAHPLVLRDMERVCAHCRDKVRCHRDLAHGTAPEHYRDYCLNAPTIDTLVERSGQ